MAELTQTVFGPTLAFDPATGRGVPAKVGRVVDAVTGAPVTTYTMDGVPGPVVTNSKGYVAPFQCDPGVTSVLVSFGSVTLPLIDQTAVLEAGAAAVAAQAAAEDAAELVGAPADLAIAAAVLAVDSATRNALDSVLGDGPIAGLVNNEDSATRRAITEHFGDAAMARLVAQTGSALNAAIKALAGAPPVWVDCPLTDKAKIDLYTASLPIQVSKDITGTVTLEGTARAMQASIITSATEVVFATIPAGYRPRRDQRVLCQGSSNENWLLGVNAAAGTLTASRYTGTQNVNAWLPVNTSWKAA
ncbi:MAG: hypothetical protein LBE25_13390 [Arthrobacter sp.]|jgi:hypothetical protein|nr:hypothetical protein [Arthrobacter sp.]